MQSSNLQNLAKIIGMNSNLIKKYVELNLIEVVRDTKNKNNNIIKFRFL